MSNATFFGELKRTDCAYAKEGQCTFFGLPKQAQNKVPIVTKCRVAGCKGKGEHYHIEASNVTCALCANWQNSTGVKP